MILRPIGGVGNRLRAMMSRLQSGLVVHFPVDWECAFGRWEDAFRPIDGVEIINVVRKPDDAFDERCDLETCDPIPFILGWERNYSRLHPSAAVADRVAELCSGIDFDAMHIRRTDHAHVISQSMPDAAFEEFHVQREGKLVYLATDNAETQARFLEYPSIFVNQRIATGAETCGYGDHTRHTSLVDSAVDMFVCAKANRFMGTRDSSFTQTIEILRGLR